MKRLAVLCLAVASLAADDLPPDLVALDRALGFEGESGPKLPEPWYSPGAASLDRRSAHSGDAAARIDRDAASPGTFTHFGMTLPNEYAGATIELRGYLRTRDVAGQAGLFLRLDSRDDTLAIDNMRDRRVDGTREWSEYRLQLPLDPNARSIAFGASLQGTGTVWADDIEILVDGKPLRDAPRAVQPASVLDTDGEFEAGSGIGLTQLSDLQVDNLATLARVWGFLKYHHPRIVRGELHWDFELFRVLPAILQAPDAAARNAALLAWTHRIGEPEPCEPCAVVPQDAQLFADLDWIHDRESLGDELSHYLEDVYRNRPSGDEQFFVVTGTESRKAVFQNEPGYETFEMPDTGYRLLALFRYWNIVEYWFPYRDVIGTPWPDVLREFLPKFPAADSKDAYGLVLSELVATVNDGHATLSDMGVLPPRGACQVPVGIRFAEGAATVAYYSHASRGPATGLRIGDVIATVDSVPVERLVAERIRHYPASNEAGKLDWAGYLLLRGPCTEVPLDVVRGEDRLALDVARADLSELDLSRATRHDRPGDTFQWLTDEIAYIKLSTIKAADIGDYIERARHGRGLVVDIRNYPAEVVVRALGGHLVPKPTEFAQLSGADLANPGTFAWSYKPLLEPLAPHFSDKVAILVDETTLSQAEYTAMALRAAPNATVIGSTTAGADGNTSKILLPGGFETKISGIGVFYPDRSPTQRVGIVPDIVVTPTVAGIRDGRDEVLERAIREITGGVAH